MTWIFCTSFTWQRAVVKRGGVKYELQCFGVDGVQYFELLYSAICLFQSDIPFRCWICQDLSGFPPNLVLSNFLDRSKNSHQRRKSELCPNIIVVRISGDAQSL